MISAFLLATLLSADPAVERHQQQHERRLAALTKPDGWLSLVGLLWLSEGDNSVGSAPSNRLRAPADWPAELGVFIRRGKAIRFAPSVPVSVQAEVDGGTGLNPYPGGPVDLSGGDSRRFRSGRFVFELIVRGERIGLRLRDPQAPTRTHFAGIPSYGFNPAWRLRARWEPAAPGSTLAVSNVLGMVENEPIRGSAVFEVGGQTYRLTPTLEDGRYFFVFGDRTNQDTTYGAGRFLTTDAADPDGGVTLDFNEAVNPPCAFTAYATCPVPPKENRLSLRVEAGERRLPGGH